MVVHHASRLHEGVANRRTGKGEPALLQVFAHGVRQGCRCGDIAMALPGILDGLAIYKLPEIFVKPAKFFCHRQTRSRIPHGCVNLQSIAHDTRIRQQLFEFGFLVAGDFRSVEIVERFAIGGALFEDRDPTEPCLRTLENKKFEQSAIIADGNTPFRIVIRFRERIGG